MYIFIQANVPLGVHQVGNPWFKRSSTNWVVASQGKFLYLVYYIAHLVFHNICNASITILRRSFEQRKNSSS